MLTKIVKRTFATAGQLLTWGETTHGWGRPVNSQFYTPGYVENFSDVVTVSTGQYHLAFITQDNGVYTTGLDQDNRLGQSSATDTELPRRLAFDNPNSQITSISCGNRHSCALTSDGAVYSWGYTPALGIEGENKSGSPVRISQEYFNNNKIVGVSAANDFSVALCEQGHFYAWGEGLGLLSEFGVSSLTPQPSKMVADLVGKRHAKIKKFTAINRFILLLLDNGRLYCFGRNKAGVFGARQNPLVMSDLWLETFAKTHDALYKNEKIVDFEASNGSLIFRTETDRIFYNGMYDKYQPTPFPHNVNAKSIFATECSVGVVSSDNKLFFLNDRMIDDSECIDPKSRLFEC